MAKSNKRPHGKQRSLDDIYPSACEWFRRIEALRLRKALRGDDRRTSRQSNRENVPLVGRSKPSPKTKAKVLRKEAPTEKVELSPEPSIALISAVVRDEQDRIERDAVTVEIAPQEEPQEGNAQDGPEDERPEPMPVSQQEYQEEDSQEIPWEWPDDAPSDVADYPDVPAKKIHSGLVSIDDDPGTFCVYAIRCRPTGRVYIGKTRDLSGRAHTHFGKLRRGRHGNKALQSDWNKFSEGSFSMEVMGTFASDAEAFEGELALIHEFGKNALGRIYNVAGVARKR